MWISLSFLPTEVLPVVSFVFPFIPIIIFVIMYVLLLRPQQQAVKRLRQKIDAVKKGDEVVTGGGHIGKVTKVEEGEVEVEFASGQRHRVIKSMLSDVRPTGTKAAND